MSSLISAPQTDVREQQVVYDNSSANSKPVLFLRRIKEQSKEPKHSPFTWLSRSGLLITSIVFLIFALALVLIWYLNSKETGFSLVFKNHYSWTYGPTAIMVLVVAVWRQIDQKCKADISWSILHEGSALAKHTVLLDYVSPLQLISFWKSFKTGHLAVTFSITGFILLKLITLVSTGLLVEDIVELPEKQVALQTSNVFNGSLYNETEYVTKSDASLVYTAYGIMAQNLSGKTGTTDNLVYNDFKFNGNLANNSVTGEMNALLPQFNCEPATVSINPLPYGTNGSQVGDTMSIVSPSCIPMGGAQQVFVLDASSEICPQRQLRGVRQRVNCSRGANEDPFPNHQLLTLVEVVYNQTFNESKGLETISSVDKPEILSFSVGIKQTTSLICQPAYQMGKVNVTKGIATTPYVTVDDVILNNDRLSNFSNEDLASMFVSALLDGANMFGDLSDSTTAEEFPNTMFGLMAASVGGRYEDLLDQATMRIAAERTFVHVAIQIVSKNILSTSDVSSNGTLLSMETRLFVSPAPLWIMVAGFLLMSVASLLLLRYRPLGCCTTSPRTIKDIAEIARQSQELQNLVQAVSLLREDELARTLGMYHFFSYRVVQEDKTTTLCIEAEPRSSEDPLKSIPDNPIPSETTWWKPLTIRRPMMICNTLLPLALIGILEYLQRNSDSNRGIYTISDLNTLRSSVYTRFIPALVMLIVATSYNAVDFNILVLAPYNSMKGRAVPASRTVDSSLVDKFPPIALWCAIKQRQYAAVFSSSAATIGSILAIIVSGLYTINPTPSYSTAVLQTIDSFNTSWLNSATNDSSAAVLTSLTESLNLTYPQSTYDELAFPGLILSNGTTMSSNSSLQVVSPALRASLSCSVMEESAYNVSAGYNSRLGSSSATVEAMLPLPPSCLFGGPGGNMTYIDVNYRVGFAENSSYIGKLLDLHVGPYDAIMGFPFGESDPLAVNDNPLACPSLAFIYGYVDIDKPSETSVTTLLCYQQIQRLEAEVTFDGPSMAISAVRPPIPHEDSIELVTSSPAGHTTFSYRIQRHMEQSLSIFNQTKYASANLADSPVDGFFQAVLFGKKSLPESTLVGPENQDTIMGGINAFYRRYMAQAITSNMRVPVDMRAATPASTTYSGVLINPSQNRRLVQHNTPKIVLQVCLGTMALLGALAWRFTQLHDLVPYNPCTIFGVLSLLAGSRMCESNTHGPSRTDGDASESQALYKLQWWDDEIRAVDDEHHPSSDGGVDLVESSRPARRRRRYGIDVIEETD